MLMKIKKKLKLSKKIKKSIGYSPSNSSITFQKVWKALI
jgi:hypothetical protein